MFHVRREGAQAGKRLLNFPKKPRASERENPLRLRVVATASALVSYSDEYGRGQRRLHEPGKLGRYQTLTGPT